MPAVTVVFYMDRKGSPPVLKWLERLNDKARDKCRVRIERLEEKGHKLGRPDCDYLGDNIYELRILHSGQNYRILYFFYERKAVILCHAFLKTTKKVPKKDKKIALNYKESFGADPMAHTYRE